jgi:hypothetical protein
MSSNVLEIYIQCRQGRAVSIQWSVLGWTKRISSRTWNTHRKSIDGMDGRVIWITGPERVGAVNWTKAANGIINDTVQTGNFEMSGGSIN